MRPVTLLPCPIAGAAGGRPRLRALRAAAPVPSDSCFVGLRCRCACLFLPVFRYDHQAWDNGNGEQVVIGKIYVTIELLGALQGLSKH